MAPVEQLNYEVLRKRQQLERGSPRLTRLEPDFYENLELYLKALHEDFQREQAANPGSPKATLLGDELTNTRRLAEDLYEHRERKVVTAALTAARGASPETANMLPDEQALYEGLVALLRDAKRRVLHGRQGPRPAPPPHVPVIGILPSAPPAAPAPTPAAPGAAAAPEPRARDGRLLVRVLEDVGSFMASDQRAYYVRREEVVSLPADTARILILRGKAVEVAPPG